MVVVQSNLSRIHIPEGVSFTDWLLSLSTTLTKQTAFVSMILCMSCMSSYLRACVYVTCVCGWINVWIDQGSKSQGTSPPPQTFHLKVQDMSLYPPPAKENLGYRSAYQYVCPLAPRENCLRAPGMDRWMDGWMGGWMNGWEDGWVDGWLER